MILLARDRVLNSRTRRQVRLGPAFEAATDLGGADARVVCVEGTLEGFEIVFIFYRFAFSTAKIISTKPAAIIGDEHVVGAFIEARLPHVGNLLGVVLVKQRMGQVDIANEAFQ